MQFFISSQSTTRIDNREAGSEGCELQIPWRRPEEGMEDLTGVRNVSKYFSKSRNKVKYSKQKIGSTMEGGYEESTGLGIEGTGRQGARERKRGKQAKYRESFGVGFLLEGLDGEARDLKTFALFAQVSSTAGVCPITSGLLQVLFSSLGLLYIHSVFRIWCTSSVWQVLEVKLGSFEQFHFCVSLPCLTCRGSLFHDVIYSQVQSQ